MCGICGQFYFGADKLVAEEDLRRMTQTLAHRGPDDEGYYLSGRLGLGFRRLSIIDLAGGHQPMSDEEGRVWVVFNGEIYNYRELRDDLQQRGYRFRTNSDTEVLVQGYKCWGNGLMERLNGMFGFALWDQANQKLILARDAMGIKPVYYCVKGGCLYFGSEIRAVVAGLGSRPPVDPVGVNLFLRYRYTPSPFTVLNGVEKLAPGTVLIVENGRPRRERWYRLRPSVPSVKIRERDARHELLEIYKRAVKRHLISDVPVGLL